MIRERQTKKSWMAGHLAKTGRKERSSGMKGFALVAAILVIFILTALGVLVFTISTQDIRISTKMVGEKKAFSAAESGIHYLTQNFNYADLPSNKKDKTVVDNDPQNPDADQDSVYTIAEAAIPTTGPAILFYTGFSIGGAQVWGRSRYAAPVTGRNERYDTTVPINTGVGYGPSDVTTLYR